MLLFSSGVRRCSYTKRIVILNCRILPIQRYLPTTMLCTHTQYRHSTAQFTMLNRQTRDIFAGTLYFHNTSCEGIAPCTVRPLSVQYYYVAVTQMEIHVRLCCYAIDVLVYIVLIIFFLPLTFDDTGYALTAAKNIHTEFSFLPCTLCTVDYTETDTHTHSYQNVSGFALVYSTVGSSRVVRILKHSSSTSTTLFFAYQKYEYYTDVDIKNPNYSTPREHQAI